MKNHIYQTFDFLMKNANKRKHIFKETLTFEIFLDANAQ